MQRAIKAFQAADAYAVADVSTAATYEIAELYRRLGEDLLKSERPKSLGPDEMEQYNLLLEEQAYPFEEKAIEIHLVNAVRPTQGIYDESVRASYTALAKLKPARFQKMEEGEDLVIDVRAGAEVATPANGKGVDAAVPLATAVRFQEAVALAEHGEAARAVDEFAAIDASVPGVAGPALNRGILLARAGRWEEAEGALLAALERNPLSASAAGQLGVVERQLGKFADSERYYERALQLDPNASRAHRNFGVLDDLYLQKPANALSHYEAALALLGGDDKQLSGWIAEVRQRSGGAAKSVQTETP